MANWDEEHLDELLEQTTWLRGLAVRLCADETTADDLVQDVWLGALASPPSGSARSWAAAVAHRLAAYRRRGRANRERRERANARPESTKDDVDLRGLRLRIVDAVLSLEEPYRSTVIARFFENLTPQQIAKQRGLPPATVRSHLARALTRLRRKLRGDAPDDLRVILGPLLPASLGRAAARRRRVSGYALGAVLVVVALIRTWPQEPPSSELPPTSGVPDAVVAEATPEVAPRLPRAAGELAPEPSETQLPAHELIVTFVLFDQADGAPRHDLLDVAVAPVDDSPTWHLRLADAAMGPGPTITTVRLSAGELRRIAVPRAGLHSLRVRSPSVRGAVGVGLQTDSPLEMAVPVVPSLRIVGPSAYLVESAVDAADEEVQAEPDDDGGWTIRGPVFERTPVLLRLRESPFEWTVSGARGLRELRVPDHVVQRAVILDGATGNPIAGARMIAVLRTPAQETWQAQAVTDAGGDVPIPIWGAGLASGGSSLALAATGYGPVTLGHYVRIIDRIERDAWDRTPIVLQPVSRLEGRLLYDTGRSAARYVVVSSISGVPVHRAHTDGDGRFRLAPLVRAVQDVDASLGEELPADELHLLCVGPDGTAGRFPGVPSSELREGRWLGVLSPIGVRRIQVENDFDEPLPGARLALAAVDDGTVLGRLYPVAQWRTDERGVVDLPDIYGDGWRVIGQAPGHESRSVALRRGRTDAHLVLPESEEEDAGLASLAIRLVQPDGEPARWVTVAIIPEYDAALNKSQVTDRDGRAVFVDLAPTRFYRVHPFEPGLAISLGESTTLRAGGPERRFNLVRRRAVPFRCTSIGALPRAGFVVCRRSAHPNSLVERWDALTTALYLNDEDLALGIFAPGFRPVASSWPGSTEPDELAVTLDEGPRVRARIAGNPGDVTYRLTPLRLDQMDDGAFAAIGRHFIVRGRGVGNAIDAGPVSPGAWHLEIEADEGVYRGEVEVRGDVDLGEIELH